MGNHNLPFDEVNRAASDRRAYEQWLPGGKRQGHEYLALNPTRNDRTVGSFSINTITWIWADFAEKVNGTKLASGGDLVSLYAYLHHNQDQGKACRDLAAQYGIDLPKWNKPRAIKPPPKAHPTLGPPSKLYPYPDSDGGVRFCVFRFDYKTKPKTFRQCSLIANKWVWQKPPGKMPLYNLPQILAKPGAPLAYAEGEKASDALPELFPERIKCTAPGGCNAKLDDIDYSPCKGRDVVLWPDNSEEGVEYMRNVRQKMLDVGAAKVRILVPPPEYGKKWDAFDARVEGWRAEDVANLEFEPEPFDGFFTVDEMRVSTWLTTEPKPREWILTDIMPVGKTGMITAPGGTGKSFMLMQLAISVASGLPLFGKFPVERPGGVMGFFSEDDDDELHRRFATCMRTICDIPYMDVKRFKLDLEKNLFLRSLVGREVTITRPSPEGPMLTANFDRFLSTAKQVLDLRILMLDSIMRFRGGSENDAAENILLVEAGERISQETGAFVLWVNHNNKYSMRQGNAMEQDASRGSSALTDGMRWQMNLATMSDHIAQKCGISKQERRFYVQMAVPKNNYAPPFGEAWLKRGEGGYLSYTELEDVDALENERILTQAIEIIRKRAEAGDEYSKRRFCERFSGKAGELKCGDRRLRAIIELGIEQKRIEERRPQKEMRNVTTVLGVVKW